MPFRIRASFRNSSSIGGCRKDAGGQALKYSAFISYNHRDKREAIRLHRALERYVVPKRLRGRDSPLGLLQKRLPPFFRDRDELASSSDLAAAVREGLEQSAFLIVICSPNSAASRWVNEEIRTFVAMGRRDRIRLIVVDGEPLSPDPARNCIPPAILEGAEGEPLAADARPGQDGREGARLKVLAALLGVPYDELRQREAQRRHRRLAIVAAASTLGFAVTTGLAIAAVIARQQAEEARRIAEARTMTAERTLGFVKGMFRVSDPSVAQGEGDKITAREVVDRGARMMETGLDKEPAAKADLGVTLAEVYNALGLYDRGYAIVAGTLKLPHGQPDVHVRQWTTLAETQAQLGQTALAIENFRRASTLLNHPGVTPSMRSHVLFSLGQALSGDGEEARGDDLMREALAIDRALKEEGRADAARDLEGLGYNAFYAGRHAEARRLVTEALAIRTEVEGPNSPSVTDNRNMLANVAYAEGDLKGAEALYRGNLARDERVLGPMHPDLGITLNNLARMLIDQRRFDEAAPLLERAIILVERQRGKEADDLVYFTSNLALVRAAQGRMAEADALFGRAAGIARKVDHPMLGPVLTDRAALWCRMGHTAEGLALTSEAAKAVARDHADTAWRVAWVENVRGGCLIAGGRRPEGMALVRKSLPSLEKRWAANTMIGAAARSRLTGAAR
ncbi:toll/interleukin-1 receptor domain-containing protein [Novosphingobium cyanobacteriorum]|uniref:Toll/interleukin-1 receptor domain-containing protein n=1 Tax=Novosphingobium cyanobacteriorum TaxID=3024215 RepID=A0ABT6CJS1_9SPHN|nr:toll/interleukin-1 receptor domain-containing protein [Novosphingobium cyanobacteriorum]MDF8333818.1 toll/interleukin-1 receptor domain-containing protein [Novosphingobium cyanobacteriorum]